MTKMQLDRQRLKQDQYYAEKEANVRAKQADIAKHQADTSRISAEEQIRSNKRKEQLTSRQLAEQERMGKSNRTANRVSNAQKTVTTAKDVLQSLVGGGASAGRDIASIIATIAGLNDPAWYLPDAQRQKDVASFPWGDMTGTVYAEENADIAVPTVAKDFFDELIDGVEYLEDAEPEGQLQVRNVRASAPGMMIIETAHTIGGASSPYDSINRASVKNFDIINRGNGRIADYEASDLTMYQLAIADLHAYIQFLKRQYMLITTFSAKSKYLSRYLLTAMDWDYDDFVKHLNDFKAHINWLIDQTAVFPVLPGLDIETRWIYDYSYMFREEATDKSQYYLYYPKHFYKLDATTGATRLVPAQLRHRSLPEGYVSLDTTMTFEWLVTYSNELLAGLFNLADVRMMRSDIEKAYGQSAYYSIPYVTETDTITPVVDELSLEQIKNADIVNVDFDSLEISQSDGYINSHVIVDGITPKKFKFIQSRKAECGPTEIIEGTRLKVSLVASDIQAGKYELSGFHHDIVTGVRMVIVLDNYPGDSDLAFKSVPMKSEFYVDLGGELVGGTSSVLGVLESITVSRAFTYAPACWIYAFNSLSAWNFDDYPIYMANFRPTDSDLEFTTGDDLIAPVDLNMMGAASHRAFYCDTWNNYAALTADRILRMNDAIALHMLTAKVPQ